jgi:hypothetical protein
VFILIGIGLLYFVASTISRYVYEDRHTLVKRSRFFSELTIVEIINLLALFIFLVLALFGGSEHLVYYSFPINGFVVFGFIPFCYIIEKFSNNALSYAMIAASLVLTVAGCFLLSMNVKSMGLKEKDLFLFKFRDYIEASKVEDPGIILEYTFDIGLYTVLDVEPICYYFQTQTLNMQEVLDYQKQYVHNGEADFVVSVGGPAEGLGDRYDFVMKDRCVFYKFDQTYYLYQRNDNPVTE